MAKTLKTRETNKYVFSIHKVIEVEMSYQEKWNMEHGLGHVDKAPNYKKVTVWNGEYEIKDETVISILRAILESENAKSK